jgi:hypothetical protein
MKKDYQVKGYICYVMLLGLLLTSLLTGCATKQISNEPMHHTDSQIAPGYGRLVFANSISQ